MHADGGGLNNTYLDYERHLCPQFDLAFTALIDDLEQRGLLQETVVAVLSEFGRTPRLNGRGGRDHYPAAWTNFLCGGNIRGGQVIGSTDRIGSRPNDNPDRTAADPRVDLPRHGHQSRHHHDARPGRTACPAGRRGADPTVVRVAAQLKSLRPRFSTGCPGAMRYNARMIAQNDIWATRDDIVREFAPEWVIFFGSFLPGRRSRRT